MTNIRAISVLLFLIAFCPSYSQQPDFMNQEPTWSPDGVRILFISKRDGNYEIYVMNSDGSNQTRLTNTDQKESEPKWSPNGKEILFASDRTGVNQIFKMNADGTAQTNLTRSAVPEYQGTWSPGGDKIAFTSIRDRNAQVYTMNVDGSNQVPLIKSKTNVNSPSWSPDGKWMVCISLDVMVSEFNHVIVNLETGTAKKLFASKGPNHFFFDWFKDSRQFIYKEVPMDNYGSSDALYSADIEFSSNQRIKKGLENVLAAKLSPDNDRLLIEANYVVYVQVLVEGKPLKLGNGYHSTEWSPDGKKVVMVSKGKMHIHTINADGTNLVKLTQ